MITKDWHTQSREQVLDVLKTSPNGLTNDEAKKRLAAYGLNEIKQVKKIPSVMIFFKQFREPLILILLAATMISAFVGELIDAIVIIAIVVLSTVVGFIQEYKSEKAIEALRKMATATCRVMRNGEEKIIRVTNLVPGDVILVSSGDRVPADAYLMEAFNLEVDEAPLTGESIAVGKSTTILTKDTVVSDRKNILYTITTVTSGRGKAVVFGTGMNTELGKIASTVQTVDLQKTPFELRMRQIGKMLSVAMLCVAGIIGILAFFRGYQVLEISIWAISVAVAAVPEALPAVIAVSLTAGVYKMAKRNAIIRRLPAVETLGSTTVICSDKTGTLTKGEMTVRRIYTYDKFASVSGVGYELEGGITYSDIEENDMILLARTVVLCNDASVRIADKKVVTIGDPTEVALVILGHKMGINKEKTDNEYPRIQEISFTSERKMMSTIHREDNKFEVFTKGATEIILNRCNSVICDGKQIPIDDTIRNRILSVTDEMASGGLRVLALAHKQLHHNDFSEERAESDLSFVGLVGMMDPPREEVIDAVAQCKNAGIDVIMITGDHKLTALAVAKEIGIISALTDESMTGNELEITDVAILTEKVERIKVYSRVSPEHKIKIVQALKNKGHIVAMTGDGINDAPALKGADIGIAMGITGTQVTKESASMILADDNFATIVSAIKEGRRIFDNVKKYLVFVLSGNIGLILILASSLVMGLPLPLYAKHILYINLATNGSPAIALGFEPHEPGIMERKPRSPKESVFFGTKKWLVGVSIILATVALSLFIYVLYTNGGIESEYAVSKARTMLFGTVVFFGLFFALSCRSFKHNITSLGPLSNKLLTYSLIGELSLIIFIMNFPIMQEIFDLVPLGVSDWILLLSLSCIGFAYSEITKIMPKLRSKYRKDEQTV
jgi:Ca2+-transporting ATPase